MERGKIRSVERQAQRMHDMMDCLEVDAGKLVRLGDGEVYAEARSRCLDCADTEKCLRWLEAFDGAAERPDFCPNLGLFEACAKDGGQS